MRQPARGRGKFFESCFFRARDRIEQHPELAEGPRALRPGVWPWRLTGVIEGAPGAVVLDADGIETGRGDDQALVFAPVDFRIGGGTLPRRGDPGDQAAI